jgi:alanyl-tRNA synthetase
MEFERRADGSLDPLPAPSIDTGMGLERLTAVLQRKESNYDTDVFAPVLGRLGEIAGLRYGVAAEHDVSMRVVADHIRATTFLIADGVIPSNEWRGYVLRKIMRRAMRHGKHLGLTEPFLHALVSALAGQMGDAYPELRASRETIERTILAEEQRFEAVLREGLPRLEFEIAAALATPDRTLPGETAFRLYDTFGVPYDFIEDTAATQDVRVDREGYERAMEAQRHRARAQSAFGATARAAEFALDSRLSAALDQLGDRFEGYLTTRLAGVPIVALFDERREPTDVLGAGETGYIVLAQTPFYVEAGGQVSDVGRIVSEASAASSAVEGLARIGPGLPRAHRVRVTAGAFHARDLVTAEVDADTRNATRRNHTATHLLHAALRQVLGSHVKQAGSLVAPDRLRFDFVHFQPATREELDRIERIVNGEIVRNTAVQTETRSTAEAIAAGAMALFGEKYGDTVRVVSVPGVSMELCGGTHVAATGDIGLFAIVAESGVAAGVRRIEAVTGLGALEWAQRQRATLGQIMDALHVPMDQAVEAIERLQEEARRLGREVTQLKTRLATGGGRTGAYEETVVEGVRLRQTSATGLAKDEARGVADSIKSTMESGVVLVTSCGEDGKVSVVVSVTPDLTARVSAGQLVKQLAPIVGGRGGGRPDFAEAGGKDAAKVGELHEAAPRLLGELLKAD